tara:strand:+ start:965 stop:1729 length:765 start_codon:yes stop_codon:yes gene_type:complete
MKYVLILSLFYKHYKKSSTLKLFLDDRFIDEIVLDKDINHIPNIKERDSNIINEIAVGINKNVTWVTNKLKANLPPDGWDKNADVYDENIKIPSKIWLYNLNLNKNPKHISLNFEIHDNNYSNSFMTKCALVKIHKIGLIPENLFYDDKNIVQKIHRDVIKIWSILPNATDRERHDWPFVVQYEFEWIGGSKKIKIPIIKKHKIFMLKCDTKNDPLNLHPNKGLIQADPYLYWLKQQQQVINTHKHEDKRNNYT